MANIRDVDVKKFVWKNIVIRFRVLESVVFDNGLQFDGKAFYKYYGDLEIRINIQPRCILRAMARLKL